MGLSKLAWPLWIIGTILIVLSWTDTVTPTIGWVGFGIAVVGVLLSFIPQARPKSPDDADGPTAV